MSRLDATPSTSPNIHLRSNPCRSSSLSLTSASLSIISEIAPGGWLSTSPLLHLQKCLDFFPTLWFDLRYTRHHDRHALLSISGATFSAEVYAMSFGLLDVMTLIFQAAMQRSICCLAIPVHRTSSILSLLKYS
jgi:hypothetical protein